MIRKNFFIISITGAVLIILLYAQLFAQSLNWESRTESDISKDAVSGLTNISSSIISDSFSPMTHYSKGDYTASLVPAYFSVKRLSDSGELRSDDLKGMAGGIGAGYALNGRLMTYAIFTGMAMNGEVTSKDFPDYTADTDYSLYSLAAGMGFDILDLSSWSLPVYLGFILQRYDIEIIPPSYQTAWMTWTLAASVKITGSDFLYGPTAAVALSGQFMDYLRITPYFLYYRSINKPELTARVKAASSLPLSPDVSEDYNFNIDEINASMFGLTFTYISSDSLSFSLSAGGLISSGSGFYNEKFLDGLEMTSIVIVITYSGKRG